MLSTSNKRRSISLKYKVDGQTYHHVDMAEIFGQNKEADKLIQKYLVNRKEPKLWDILPLGFAINPRPDPDMYCDLFCISPGVVILIIIWLILLQ